MINYYYHYYCHHYSWSSPPFNTFIVPFIQSYVKYAILHTFILFITISFNRIKLSYKLLILKKNTVRILTDCGVQRSWQRAWFGTKRSWVQIPSLRPLYADMAELADAYDSGSYGKPCRFKSCYPHHGYIRIIDLGRGKQI